jgi:hypothetical protein
MTGYIHFRPSTLRGVQDLNPSTPVLLAAAALGLALIAFGGIAGMVGGFVVALLALDRLFPEPRAGKASAERSFKRASRTRGRESERLSYLAEDDGWAATAERRPLGVQEIATDSIVGTVEQGKAAAFDRRFSPPDFSRERWTGMWVAANRGTELPPISVYRVGDVHFVRDGHHRVSVANALGMAATDAEVVELRPVATASNAQLNRRSQR